MTTLKPNNKVIVVGSSNTDMVCRSVRLPQPGETILGGSFDIIQGGKGANQAVAAARAGAEVIFAAKVGDDDFGRNAIQGYRKDRIDTGFLQQSESHPTGVAVILVDENTGQNSIVVASGANAQLTPEDIENAAAAIAGAAVLLVQLETPLPSVQRALEIARSAGVTTILNPAPAAVLNDDLLSLVDIITPNESETAHLIGLEPRTKTDIRKAAALLLKKVRQAVIITLGGKGVYFVSHSGEHGFLPASKVKAVDTTAAGDVFNGYLAAALAKEISLQEGIQWAIRAATLSVTRKGAQPSIPFAHEL